jgi:hypothetical protein
MPSFGVVLLPSTEHALVAEEVLHKAGFKVRLMPVPRSISSECGMCLRFKWEDRQAVEKALAGRVEGWEIRELW